MLEFNLHIGDFAKKTMHLTHEERGIYLSLLMRYYDTEQPLPADTDAVARLACVRNADAMQAVCAVLDEFFVLMDDGWHSKRADAEIEKYQLKRAKAKKSADARWAGVSDDSGGDKKPSERKPQAKPTESERNANASETHSEGNAIHDPRSTNLSKEPPVVPQGDSGPTLESVMGEYNRILGDQLRKSLKPTKARHRALKARISEAAKRKDLSWWAEYFEHCRNSDFLMGRTPPRPGHEHWQADLDWLLNESNMVKIIEGKYHGGAA